MAALITGLASATELFVAPGGDDTQTGTRDQPFATIHRAQEAARAARKARPGEGITVTLRGGQYQLDRPLEFSAADSGASPDAPVRYRAADGEEVVFSGGRTITSWQPDPDRPGVWKTRVADPDQEEGSAWRFEQLWVNQQRAVRARTPNDWHFHQLAGDVVEDCLFFFENFLAALDAPGEWFLDRDGWLYYYPRAGENMATAQVVAPRLDRFVVVQGNEEDPGQWVAHLRFEGLTFRHAEFRIPPEGHRPQLHYPQRRTHHAVRCRHLDRT